jgi:hypothetical protein
MARRKLEAAPHKATTGDLRRAQSRERFLRTELDRVRNAATAWRNGLVGLLAAITGFGLIKGQSDISRLSPVWSGAAGLLLLIALIAGLIGALTVLRAAHGLPVIGEARSLGNWYASEHHEALMAARSLRTGIASTLACAVALVAAVGVTWYGPSRDGQQYVRVVTNSGAWCGQAVRLSGGNMWLQGRLGPIKLPVSAVQNIIPVNTCG